MEALFIEQRRAGYSPKQCGNTITVGELISLLMEYDEETPVYIKNDNGYTFGNIQADSITEENREDFD